MLLTEAFFLFGLLFISKFLFYWLRVFYAFFVAHRLGLSADFRRIGKWAVITGGTDGIGKGFAHQLAAKGFNIIVIGRDREKALKVCRAIEMEHPVLTQVLSCDFAEDEERYEKLRERLEDFDVGVLVNNVGMCLKYPEYFHKMPDGDAFVHQIIRCNMLSATLMTRICLPKMLQCGGGYIINIASASALLPAPLVAVYSASKAYVDFLSRSLQQEYGPRGIIVQSVLPFTVSTKMTGQPKNSFFVPTPDQYADSCLRTLGILSRTHGCFAHTLQGWYYASLPEFISTRLQWNFFSSLRTTMLAQLKDAKK